MTALAISLIFTILVWLFSSSRMRTRNLFWLGLISLCALGLTGCDPTSAKNIFTEAYGLLLSFTPFIASVASLLLPAEATAINAIATRIEAGTQAVKDAEAAYTATPSDGTLADLQATLTAIHTDLPQLEAAANVVNPAAKSKLQGEVYNIQQALALAENQLVKQHAATVAAAPPGA